MGADPGALIDIAQAFLMVRRSVTTCHGGQIVGETGIGNHDMGETELKNSYFMQRLLQCGVYNGEIDCQRKCGRFGGDCGLVLLDYAATVVNG